MLVLVNDSKYFDIIIQSLAECLTELGIPYILVSHITNYNDNDNTYLICTTHENKPLPVNYISYNFEQLTTNKKWDMIFFNKLRRAKFVLDYSLENMKLLKTHNIEAIHLPLGYTKYMEHSLCINKEEGDLTYDFMFIGCINNKRFSMLEKLFDYYLKLNKKEKLLINNSCWDNELVLAYKKSKIGINMHYYEGSTILEVHRIIPLILNKVWVLSERSDDSWYDEKYKKYITFFNDKNDLLRKGLFTINKPFDDYKKEIDERYNLFKENEAYVDYVKAIDIFCIPL